MFAGGILLATTLMFFACWLQWTELNGWPHDTYTDDDDETYRTRRRKSRLLVNILIGTCSLLIFAATFAGVGIVFVAAWSTVSMILMVIVVLAGLDAFRTHRHHQDKIRRMQERAIKE